SPRLRGSEPAQSKIASLRVSGLDLTRPSPQSRASGREIVPGRFLTQAGAAGDSGITGAGASVKSDRARAREAASGPATVATLRAPSWRGRTAYQGFIP